MENKLKNISVGGSNNKKYLIEDVRVNGTKRFYDGLKADPDNMVKHVKKEEARKWDSKSEAKKHMIKQNLQDCCKVVSYENSD